MIGKTLAHYEILEKIGSGGMGEVYLARDTKLERDVALKILPPAVASDPERRQRFEREAKAIASLQHPHIVTIHSIEETGETHFLTMELVRGKTLDELIPAGGLPLDRLFEVGVPLAEAVHAAHERGVIHRDLKPGNVMVDEAGHLKVLDFGLAKLMPIAGDSDAPTMTARDSTGEGRILGTVAYMSPEQVDGKVLDRRSDVFSLGVVLYEAATGKRPFSGDSPISTMSAILRETPPSITSLKPLPRHLGRIIHRCLEKNPDKRFQTARDVANGLEGLQREVESGEVEPLPGVSQRAGTPTAHTLRHGWKMAWIGLAAAMIIAAIAAWVILSRRPPATGTQLVTHQLTSHVTPEWAGSWSPDGSFFAFMRCTRGPQDIYVSSTAGGDPICLVQGPSDDFDPRWSPDNRWIAFASNREGTVNLYLVPPLGGPVRMLAETGFEGLGGESDDALGTQPWAPDGKRLAFSRKRDDQIAVWIIDIESGEETRLTDPEPGQVDGQPCWSFDGERIAFRRSSAGPMTICVVPAGGGEVRSVHAPGWLASPSWSPDGKSVLYAADVGGISNLLAVNVSNGVARQLTSSSIDISHGIVGGDGRILYNDFSHQTDLYLQSLDGSESRRLTFHTETNFAARISPDGERLVYESDRTGSWDIWLLEIESGREQPLADHPAADREADWSPDGERIVFVSERSGNAQLWTMSPEGGNPVQITDQEGVAGSSLSPRGQLGAPRWSPDGSVIGFMASTEGGQSIWAISPDGKDPRPVLPHALGFDWYRDSRHLVYTPSDAPTEIRVRDLETSEERILVDEPHLEVATSPDGSGFTYCAATSHFNMHLQLVRLEASETDLPRLIGEETLAEGKGLWHVHNGGWAPDGEGVVYTRDTDIGDVYMLEGVF